MKRKNFTRFRIKWLLAFVALLICGTIFMASSHREAPLIAQDPLADNTDLYAFRSPANPDKVVIIANWIPFELPQGGPNFYQFGKDIRYEIHIDNNINTPGDDIVYRFTFKQVNQDPSTFFNIRLGKLNLLTSYLMEKSVDGGKVFSAVLRGRVLPPNIGPRSITTKLGYPVPASYSTLMNNVIKTSPTGEKVYIGTADDPFFVDLGGIFDLGDAPRQSGKPIDGLKCLNISTIAMEIDISALQKDHKTVGQASSILDPNYVIGVWASASRRKIRTLNDVSGTLATESHSGSWIQVSRIGMPLTNEAVIPIGKKDYWNRLTPYKDLANLQHFKNAFYNPELALYMDDSKFGGAVPAFAKLRVQRNSLHAYDFGNTHNGLFALKGTPAVAGTALAENAYGGLLLPAAGSPRSVDIWPIFHTGVPNMAPYQLATGKGGNPLAVGKPFINNFLPNGGDMLRLNMAVPVTPRNSADFSSLGLVQAAVLGLTDSRYNITKNLEFIPNMDGFPNGRRLEDDVTRIELQAVGGIVLAAIGLWYDDFNGFNPVSQDLIDVLSYSTGVEHNDTTFKTAFPFVQTPWAGTHICNCGNSVTTMSKQQLGSFNNESKLGISSPEMVATISPNPVFSRSTISYKVEVASKINVTVYDGTGKVVKILTDKNQQAGTYNIQWNVSALPKGSYFISISKNGQVKQTLPLVKSE